MNDGWTYWVAALWWCAMGWCFVSVVTEQSPAMERAGKECVCDGKR